MELTIKGMQLLITSNLNQDSARLELKVAMRLNCSCLLFY